MEFAVEMIIKASLHKVRVVEVPVTLYKDGRKTRRAHLRTFRDGWRTLKILWAFRFAHCVRPASLDRRVLTPE